MRAIFQQEINDVADFKRTTYLINPKFQIRFSLFFCGLIFLSSLIYPLTIYDLLTSFIEYTSQSSLQISSQLEDRRSSLLVILSLWQLAFLLIVFIISVFFSHKIAGPMFKLQKFLNEKKNGTTHDKLYFRKGDYFHEVADDINAVFDQIDKNQFDDLIYLDEVKSYLGNLGMVVPEDKQAVLQEITSRIELIQERYNR